MTLVFDEREKLKQEGKPGLHALIVGVSAYPHLPGGTDTTTPDSHNMQQLSSTARTAYMMYRWLVDSKDRLLVPLATIRMLLSPSPGEVATVVVTDPTTGNPLPVDRATRANFEAEANQWRKDSATRKDNCTFFYFAGHGVQSTNKDSVILLENFGDGLGGTLSKTVRTDNLWSGLAPTTALPNMARTQLYFIDACQSLPRSFVTKALMSVPDVFDVDLNAPGDDRHAPVIYATVPGTVAYSLVGAQTLFSQALLNCLNGKAGDRVQEPDGSYMWRVTFGSLIEALRIEFSAVLAKLPATAQTEQKITVGGFTAELASPIVNLSGTPDLDLTIELIPSDSQGVVKLRLVDAANNMVGEPLPSPLTPNPYPVRVKAGFYRVVANIEPPTQPFVGRDDPSDLYPYRPPTGNRKVRVIP